MNTEKSKHFKMTQDDDKAKLIAFYLPQFHAIEENNKWWGEGFTEWTNTKKAKPLFEGHYQPHTPHNNIGYYNLLDSEIKEKQAQMAREHGIYGFCYYVYWFPKRLLEKPIDQVIETKKPDFPFCICWPNESWTKRWDGKDNEVLIKQEYPEGWELDFIKDMHPYLSDKRYIKVNGKLLLLIWRPEELPDSKKAAKIWREYTKEQGLGELHIVKVESHRTDIPPEDIGFDAATEFAPNKYHYGIDISEKYHSKKTDKYKVYDYNRSLEGSLISKKKNYKRYKCVFPCWDNTARCNQRATVFVNDTPSKFKQMLSSACKYTYTNFEKEEQIIFVNAWNEWAEGCHLEPDQKNGYSYLKACKEVIETPVKEVLAAKFETKNQDNIYIDYLKKNNFENYLFELARKLNSKPVILYGAGMFLEAIKDNYELSGLNIVAISDLKYKNNIESYQNEFKEFKKISPEDIKSYDNTTVLLSVLNPDRVIDSVKRLIKNTTNSIDYIYNSNSLEFQENFSQKNKE